LPHIITRGGGSIVYTSSNAAHAAEPSRLAYAMSKAAIHAFMRHVARRFGPEGIRANVITPGAIMHKRLEGRLSPNFLRRVKEYVAIKSRLGAPAAIAAAAALLMDGGASMRP
jgi:NAD(P)-dependent dehydrogenase (short-subunit alcohol dehydrogenase family)